MAGNLVTRDGGWCSGIMSGTSLDGVDMALIEVSGSGPQQGQDELRSSVTPLMVHRVAAFTTFRLPAAVRENMRKLWNDQGGSSRDVLSAVCDLNTDWSVEIAKLVSEFLDLHFSTPSGRLHEGVRPVIGSHGQTLWHNSGHSTIQIGDGEVLAHQTNCTVVSNFRAADVAVGGTGAPLVPYYDRLLVAAFGNHPLVKDVQGNYFPVVLQNLGGMGNLTYFRHASSATRSSVGDDGDAIQAFDTGPANVVLNELLDCYAGDEPPISPCLERMDYNAAYSSHGEVVADLLAFWQSIPYFAQKPPKTTGREQFGAPLMSRLKAWLLEHHYTVQLGRPNNGSSCVTPKTAKSITLCDLCRTAVELTAWSVAQAYREFLPQLPHLVLLSGGGASHPLIVRRLMEMLPECRVYRVGDGVRVTNELGLHIDPVLLNSTPAERAQVAMGPAFDDMKEAIAFAVLAHERLMGPGCAERLRDAGAIPMIDGGSATSPPKTHFGTNEPSVTSAKARVLLGQVSQPL